MAAFHHAVGQPRAVLFYPQKPSTLFQAVIELLEIALGQLGNGYVSQLRDNVLIDPVFIVCLGLGLDGRFAVGLLPVIQPGPESHVPFGPFRLCTLETLL